MAHNGASTTESRGDTALIVALATGCTHEEAAQRSGVSLRTISRRLADPDFRDRVNTERQTVVTQVMGRLTANSLAASSVLLAIAESDEAPPAARVTAARATIDLATRLRDQVDVVERLAALEAILAARTDGAP